MAILTLLMALLAAMVNATSLAWTKTRSTVEQFQQAREAFDTMTRRLSEATLNPYYDYIDATGKTRTPANTRTFVPDRYVRQSELRFLSGPGITGKQESLGHAVFFQAPEGRRSSGDGLENLLNTVGFFVELGDDGAFLPSILNSSFAKERFRLLQYIEPSEKLSVYNYTAGNFDYTGKEWFQTGLNQGSGVSIVAENMIALVLLPMLTEQDQAGGGYTDDSLAPNYLYDSTTSRADAALNSKNQLPPVVKVTMVALDETSAKRMSDSERADLKALLDGLFTTAGSTTDPSLPGYAQDLKTLEDKLTGKKLNYRVFSSNVALKAAKWSREQKN